MTGDCHVRFCERLGVKFPLPTRQFTIGYFGERYKLFQVFLLMVCRNIGSIEQTKHVRRDEAMAILGLWQFPGKDKLWEWFYQATGECLSPRLLKDFFRFQIVRGIVNLWLWFIDGHRLAIQETKGFITPTIPNGKYRNRGAPTW